MIQPGSEQLWLQAELVIKISEANSRLCPVLRQWQVMPPTPCFRLQPSTYCYCGAASATPMPQGWVNRVSAEVWYTGASDSIHFPCRLVGLSKLMCPLPMQLMTTSCCAAEGMCRYFLSCPTVQHLASEQRAQLQTQPIYSHLLKAAAGLVEASRGMGAQQLGWLAGSLLQLLRGSLGTVEKQVRLHSEQVQHFE